MTTRTESTSRGDGARILFLGHGAERTGPPILLGHLLRGLAASRPWARSVLVARSGPLLAEYRRSGADARAISDRREPLEPLAAGLRRVGAARSADALQGARRRWVARNLAEVDLVYVNAATPPTAALLRALAVPASVPVLLHVHELDIGLRDTLGPDDRRLLFERADHLVAASSAVGDLLVAGHGLDRDRVTVCEEFVDVAAIRPLPRAAARQRLGVPTEATVVGSVGLPDVRKDPDHLLRAVASLSGREVPWIVWIGGDPASPDGRRLAREAERLGLGHRTRHLGHVDDPTSLLAALDVFALPAREDAMPLAALEAAAAGLALVCFRTGGIADLCDRGAGTAVDYPDTAGFARAIDALLEDPSERAAVGGRARALVQAGNDVAVGTERIASVMDRLLDRR